MNTGSVLAYEPTHSIATKGAIRQRAMATRRGVTTAALVTSDASDISRLRPLTDRTAITVVHLCNAQAIMANP
ncbi:hypothetical protein GCM10011578_077440 [Streptomyces fuscichromogenes]|uniref:Uncharacterized protein n=1 Tax=Streptomyces fuscichromogenes TaxID=1324013 RepID=A0A917XKQ2_9ACTN|nr:hypothetical protein GCM10011578_077440 [Streptomyces fuscichromogenes]